MIIRPGEMGLRLAYATGSFAEENDAFVVNEKGGTSPFGGILCSLDSDYAVEVIPDGTGRSWRGALDITSVAGLGKAWYLKDKETGRVWSAFAGPVPQSHDEYEVSLLPGRARVRSVANKIACTLTLAVIPGTCCEIWHVRVENMSAEDRTIVFTTYAEPRTGNPLEAVYTEKKKTLLLRRSLESSDINKSSFKDSDLVVYHSSTLMPVRYHTDKVEFVGEGRSLRDPAHIENDNSTSGDGTTHNPLASLTVEVDLPLEGEAEFGFCFGVAESVDQATELAGKLADIASLTVALDSARSHWEGLSSILSVRTPDRTLNALINTWLPYEAYAELVKERNTSSRLSPRQAAAPIRRIAPLCAAAPDACLNTVMRFAARMSAQGGQFLDGSLISVPPSEMLWLAIAVASYVAETGDTTALTLEIALGTTVSLTLREHCERAIRMCFNSDGWKDYRLLTQTIRLWALATEDATEFSRYLDELESRQRSDKADLPETWIQPKRLGYLQSICPVLTDPAVAADVAASLALGEDLRDDAGVESAVYSAIVERVLGLVATREGLTLSPSLPESWSECDMTRRFRGDIYNIHIRRIPGGKRKGTSIVVDGEPVLGSMLPYTGDGHEYMVDVTVV